MNADRTEYENEIHIYIYRPLHMCDYTLSRIFLSIPLNNFRFTSFIVLLYGDFSKQPLLFLLLLSHFHSHIIYI